MFRVNNILVEERLNMKMVVICGNKTGVHVGRNILQLYLLKAVAKESMLLDP